MIKYGAEEFQKEREILIIKLIKEACELLLIEETQINAPSVTKKITVLFKKYNIDKKYHIKEQSIGRNKTYKRIWQSYQKKQKLAPSRTVGSVELDEFEIRDSLDMLQQDYIELNDENNFLRQEHTKLKKENASLLNKSPQNNLNYSMPLNNENVLPSPKTNILTLINSFLRNGPIAIVKNNDTGQIIIKNIQNSNQERTTISILEWEKLCE